MAGNVEDRPGVIEGLTPDLITDLIDIGVKYGSIEPDSSSAVYSPGPILPFPFIVGVSMDRKKNVLAVAKFGQESMVRVPTNHGTVVWEDGLTVDEAKQAVKGINQLAETSGYYNPKTNERSFMPVVFLKRIT